MSNQETKKKRYWFPAKKNGWGWGFPRVWQGWATLLFYFLAIALNFYFFPTSDEKNILAFVLIVMLLSVALVDVCFVKGEPPAKSMEPK